VRVRHGIAGQTVALEKQIQLGAGIGRLHLPQVRQVVMVHGQNQIEIVEVIDTHLARAQWLKIIATAAGELTTAAIRRFTTMPVSRAGGVDMNPLLEAGRLDLMPKYRLGGR